MPEYVYALYDFTQEDEDDLPFKAGDRIEVLEKDDMYRDGWWEGRNPLGKTGLFPQSYITTDRSALQPRVPHSDGHNTSGSGSIPANQSGMLTNNSDAKSKTDGASVGDDDGIMRAILADVTQAIEQLGRTEIDTSFSFASTPDGDTADRELNLNKETNYALAEDNATGWDESHLVNGSEHYVEASQTVVSVRRKADSALVLRTILASLKHLDLTGKIRFDSAVMKTHGGYADVFMGYATLERSQGTKEIKVAIKRLRVHIQGDHDFAKSLSKEIRVWSRLSHRNVLAFVGYALEGEDYPLLISEWMENGTAITYVKKNPECVITRMILGIAEGLAYLHSQGVIHADMKADNVLVSADGQPRLCDFGISSILASSTTLFGVTSSHNYTKGSLRWMAIEFFQTMDPPVLHSEKTDVWAFGMTAYELIAERSPYAHIKLDPQVLLAIMQGSLPLQPDFFSKLSGDAPQRRIWAVCQACWKRSPETRPDMRTIARMLR